MERISFCKDWTYIDMPGAFADPHCGVPVDLPHDFSQTKERRADSPGGAPFGFFQGGSAVYQKTFTPSEEWKGKNVQLEFEAVYKDASIYLNGLLLYRHPYGYTGFFCDITEQLRWGEENTLQVQVYNEDLPNTRWYSGSGITRPVWLRVAPNVHIAPEGVFVKPTDISEDACTLEIETCIEGAAEGMRCNITQQVIASNGAIVAALDAETFAGAAYRQKLRLECPQLWFPEHPNLYTLHTEISCENHVDTRDTTFGVRSISVSPDKGFQLNGVTMKLKGGCVHSENGILGARSFAHGEEWKVRKLLENGFNAVRCAHNPPAKSFLDACDRLGLLVIDEAFDVWQDSKNKTNYGRYFMEWWQRDLGGMVRRDRNHPSIIMWSTGNEVKELLGTGDGFRRSAELARFVREMDNSRPITNALQEVYLGPTAEKVPAFELLVPDDIWQKHSQAFSTELDVVGYNYARYHYAADGKAFPNRVICGEESHPLKAYENWRDVETYPYVIGDFVWTALDYFGEAGCGFASYQETVAGMEGMMQMFGAAWPYHLATTGDLDLCGHKRPQSYYRDCVWRRTETPYIGVYDPEYYGKTPDMSCWGWHPVSDCWTWNGFEGKKTMVDVYSTADQVALYVNGELIETRAAGQEDMAYLFRFPSVTYQPGEVTAVAYSDGGEVGRKNLYTEKAPVRLELTCDRTALPNVYGEIAYVDVTILDENRARVQTRDEEITISVEGPAKLLAVGSANPRSNESYVENRRKSYQGRLQAVICATGEGEGAIRVAAVSDRLRAEIVIPCQ